MRSRSRQWQRRRPQLPLPRPARGATIRRRDTCSKLYRARRGAAAAMQPAATARSPRRYRSPASDARLPRRVSDLTCSCMVPCRSVAAGNRPG